MTIVPNLDTLPTPTAVSTYAGIPPKFFTLNLQNSIPVSLSWNYLRYCEQLATGRCPRNYAPLWQLTEQRIWLFSGPGLSIHCMQVHKETIDKVKAFINLYFDSPLLSKLYNFVSVGSMRTRVFYLGPLTRLIGDSNLWFKFELVIQIWIGVRQFNLTYQIH